LNYEYYNYSYDNFEIEENRLNFSAGLEYRFNFSKWFSPYIYGGVSFDYNLSANATYDSESYNLYDYTDHAERFAEYVDFGAGLKINHLQFNISKSILQDYFEDSNNSFIDNPGKVVFSVAYIF
ncbi:MAG: outer membrane beta-barrel protein, partial [Dysgonamonadaceae bacterium]|nr:outer membrane beta-barrel protein [Dysgonamonadaceae bacterium]